MSLVSSLIPAFASATARSESTPTARPAEPAVAPRHEITETPDAYALLVELPGVARDGLELTVDHERIRVVGRRAWRKPEAWKALHRESREAGFELALDHGRAVDADKIRAELRDGVLRVALPKAEALKPRKIAVA